MEDFSSYQKFYNVKPLTLEEEIQLFKRKEEGDLQAIDEIAERNLLLVISVARHYQNCGLPLDDLIQEGSIGLLKAIHKFDLAKGYRFATYAPWWIRQSITRALADQGRIMKIPAHIVENINKVKDAERKFLASVGRIPTDEEIANLKSLDVEEVTTARAFYHDAGSLDVPVGTDESDTLGDFVEDTRFVNPELSYIKESNKDVLESVLKTLKPREADVIKKRFGLKTGKNMTLEEVGKDYHLTKERIRQIENKALMKLRAPARANFLRESINGD